MACRPTRHPTNLCDWPDIGSTKSKTRRSCPLTAMGSPRRPTLDGSIKAREVVKCSGKARSAADYGVTFWHHQMSHHSHTRPATTESQHEESKISTESLRKRYLWQAVPARRSVCEQPALRPAENESSGSVARQNRWSANPAFQYERMCRGCWEAEMALAEAERQAAERERLAAARQAEEERRRSQPQPQRRT